MASVIRGSDNMDSAQVRPVLMAAQAASGTAVDFTGIPSWVQKVTVTVQGLSTGGTSLLQIQLGTGGGLQTTGYAASVAGLVNAASVTTVLHSTGVPLIHSMAAVVALHGVVTLVRGANDNWVFHGNLGRSDLAVNIITAGSKSLGAALDRIRVTTVNGTDTFDAGTINVVYE